MICRYIATVMKVKTDIIILITAIGLAMICRYIVTVMKVKTDIIALIQSSRNVSVLSDMTSKIWADFAKD